VRALERKQLPQLADELRAFLIDSVSQTGGIWLPTWARWS